MARTKQYNETEVIEKAMNLFWLHGYEMTSMQMLEKEMGINKFSIYASFGNKNGVFLESLKCYKQKLNQLFDQLDNSVNGITSIKQFFYDFVDFSKETEFGKGCLLSNTASELGDNADDKIKHILTSFTTDVRSFFIHHLQQTQNMSKDIIETQTDYLIIAMFGLSSATRIFSKKQLEHYIEGLFKNL
ncbi:MAG: TetR/AcrR family transcriptional regulator [Psychroflexus sp.]|nr:TetR/AcrR family transcriptional regulator [Psychroflexus sp.]MDN6310989.1 TetR/AcrR family transcriptional regulator [Psychroflexus sp.]